MVSQCPRCVTDGLAFRVVGGVGDSQSFVHLLERFLGLLEEVEDQWLGKFTFGLILIHLQDLGEGLHVDAVAKVWQSRILVLMKCH